MIEFLNVDCIELMKLYPNNHFDLAIVDPPFGIGENWRKDPNSKFYSHRNDFNNKIPGREYFDELFRVSKNQIIWGANYYWNFLPPSNNLIFWDKLRDPKKTFNSAGELAWTSIKTYPFLKYTFLWNGYAKCEYPEKIHPHQKPVLLYRQTLIDFAKEGFKILDTHAGSGSIAIACMDLNYDLVMCEKDPEYYSLATERIAKHQKLINEKNKQGKISFS